MMQNVFLSDIAKRTGVSVSTVSRVIRGVHKRPNRLSMHILGVAKDMGYASNSLDLGNGIGNIGCILVGMHCKGDGSVDSEMGYTQRDFFSGLIYGVERETQKYKGNLILLHLGKGSGYLDEIRAFVKKNNLQGIILTVNGDLDGMEAVQDVCPVVHLNAAPSWGARPTDMVASDDIGGIQLAVRQLVELGHRRIAFWMDKDTSAHHKCRLSGYQTQLILNGLDYSRIYYEDKRIGLPFIQRMKIAFQEYLNDPQKPTAILCACDIFAQTLLRLAREHGIRIPEDLSLSGFDNIDADVHSLPSLSSVEVNMDQMGREAVRLLVRRLEEPKISFCQMILPSRFIMRESIGPVPKTDE